MQRFDIYTLVHKAVRALLFDTVEAVGRTDFSRTAELPATLAAVRRTSRLTHAHAEHEDREIHPFFHRVAPEFAAELEAGHDRFDGAEAELEKLLARLENPNASVEERVSLGRKLHDLIGPLAADHLVHMAVEETRGNRLLWAHHTDAELQALQGRILAAIPPDEASAWLELMVRAGNLTERAGLIASVRAAVPPAAFAGLTAAARAGVGERAWNEAVEAANALAPATAGA
jgi:hypothetical protein